MGTDRELTSTVAAAAAEREQGQADAANGVINRIFRAGLTLAGILSLERVDAEVAERIRDAIDALDAVVGELRTAALAEVVGEDAARSEGETETEAENALSASGRRRLSGLAINGVFAYAVGRHDFYRAADNVLWAHESDGWLLSARSGVPLARRDGTVFYDVDSNAPLYYEDEPAVLPLAAERRD
jgi:hypothetical protein